MSYQQKYLKYKNKYLVLKTIEALEGGHTDIIYLTYKKLKKDEKYLLPYEYFYVEGHKKLNYYNRGHKKHQKIRFGVLKKDVICKFIKQGTKMTENGEDKIELIFSYEETNNIITFSFDFPIKYEFVLSKSGNYENAINDRIQRSQKEIASKVIDTNKS